MCVCVRVFTGKDLAGSFDGINRTVNVFELKLVLCGVLPRRSCFTRDFFKDDGVKLSFASLMKMKDRFT